MQGEQRKAGSPDASQATWNSLLSLAQASYSLPERWKQLRKSHPLTATNKQIRSNTGVGRNGRLSGPLSSDSQESTGRKKNSKPHTQLVTGGQGTGWSWPTEATAAFLYWLVLLGVALQLSITKTKQSKKKNQDTNQAWYAHLAKQIKGKHLSKQEVPKTPNLHQWAATGSSLFLH